MSGGGEGQGYGMGSSGGGEGSERYFAGTDKLSGSSGAGLMNRKGQRPMVEAMNEAADLSDGVHGLVESIRDALMNPGAPNPSLSAEQDPGATGIAERTCARIRQTAGLLEEIRTYVRG